MASGPTALMQLKGGRGGWSHNRGPGSRRKLQKGLRSPRSETQIPLADGPDRGAAL